MGVPLLKLSELLLKDPSIRMLFADNPNSCFVSCTAEVHGTGAPRGVVLDLWLLERTNPHKSLQRKTGMTSNRGENRTV